MSGPACPVTHELCTERMDHIRDSLEQINVRLDRIDTKLDVIVPLEIKVEEHDRFIRDLRKWGLRILLVLAGVAVSGGAIKISDLIKP